jgi:hypothetical protein
MRQLKDSRSSVREIKKQAVGVDEIGQSTISDKSTAPTLSPFSNRRSS